jgi:hypothetical protein
MQNKWRLLPRRLWGRRLTSEDIDEFYARSIGKTRGLIKRRLSVLPEGSAKRASLERLQSLSDEALVDDLFSSGHPNPERIGCPPRDVLIALARKERAISDPGYDHIAKCSPCWVEVRDLKQSADVISAHESRTPFSG